VSLEPSSADNGETGPTRGVPRWVKVFLIATVVLAVLLLIVALFGGGRHGPSRHLGSLPTIAALSASTTAAGW
jgi:hypothetical protein